jgi:AraC-like DNA-binding protein
MLTDVRFNSLYLQRSKQWSRYECEVVEISPLFRELILTALKIGSDQQMTKREDLIVRLIVEELMTAKRGAWPIPLPQDHRLLSLCQRILEQPSLGGTLDQLASEIGSSPKTIARLFDRELGMSFRKWREQVQVANAVAHLVQGMPIKVVANSVKPSTDRTRRSRASAAHELHPRSRPVIPIGEGSLSVSSGRSRRRSLSESQNSLSAPRAPANLVGGQLRPGWTHPD